MERPGTKTEPLLGDSFVGCRLSTYQARGLGILHLQNMNTALLIKWVTRTMGP